MTRDTFSSNQETYLSWYNNLHLMYDSWSRAPDQIQMYPNRDTIAQLLPARRLCFFVFAGRLFKYIKKHLMYDPSGNSEFCFPSSPEVSRDEAKTNKQT